VPTRGDDLIDTARWNNRRFPSICHLFYHLSRLLSKAESGARTFRSAAVQDRPKPGPSRRRSKIRGLLRTGKSALRSGPLKNINKIRSEEGCPAIDKG